MHRAAVSSRRTCGRTVTRLLDHRLAARCTWCVQNARLIAGEQTRRMGEDQQSQAPVGHYHVEINISQQLLPGFEGVRSAVLVARGHAEAAMVCLMSCPDEVTALARGTPALRYTNHRGTRVNKRT
ncbi:hypothetical protein Bbelb_005310 [Branchiostoma belcheri]|nr:hypothetical protein Bbelb_005310 [Branchiostoma belcheri]